MNWTYLSEVVVTGSDPFEEFEFKPLTEGLGFHKKTPSSNSIGTNSVSLSSTSSSASLTTTKLPAMKTEALPLEPLFQDLTTPNERSLFSKTLPKKEDRLGDSIAHDPHSQAVDQILKNLQKTKNLDFKDSASVSASKIKTSVKAPSAPAQWIPSGPSLMAGTLDAMLILAAGLLCMIILLVVTQADLLGNLSNPDANGAIYLSTLSLFAMVTFVYQSAHRLFIGYTPGEWAFEQRVGHPSQFGTQAFALKAIVRSLTVVATGFFVLPLIGFLFNKDIVGAISRARLYSLN